MGSTTAHQYGQLVADFLTGSWRAIQAPLELSLSDLERLTSLLYNSGGAGLAWWRIHDSELKTTRWGELLHQGYRMQALQTAINEERIVRAFGLLRDAAIEPILIKGWAVAQAYPHATLRPYGDIDLVVRMDQYATAREVLSRDAAGTWWVDLHQGLSELNDRSIDGVFERSRTLTLHDVPIRVLSCEDQLALLAIHLFKHGAWRPLWLCDIAAMAESLPQDFDEKVCLGSNRNQSAWIGCAIGLARELLNANRERDRLTLPGPEVPPWIVRAVLEQWGKLIQPDHLPVQARPVFAYTPRSPRTLVKQVRERWPTPIVATFKLRGQPNNLPRLPYQLGAFAAHAAQYMFTHLRPTSE